MEKQSGSKLIEKCRSELFGVDLVFEEFISYFELMNNFLEQKATEFEKDSHKYRKEIDERSKRESSKEENKDIPNFEGMFWESLDSQFSESWFEITVIFPNNFRCFFLTQLYSFIETELRKICEYHHIIRNTEYSIKDLTGSSDLDRIKKYLYRTCKINPSQVEKELEIIDKMRKIRNKIIHHKGLINKKDPDWSIILTVADEWNWIILNEQPAESDDFLIIIGDTTFIKEFIKTAKMLFSKLLEENLMKFSV